MFRSTGSNCFSLTSIYTVDRLPVRRYLPELINLVLHGKINPGKVFDLALSLESGSRGLSSHGRAPRNQDSSAPEW